MISRKNLLSVVALQALASTALAGNAIINNKCGYDVYVESTATGAKSKINAGGTFTEGLKASDSSVSIKLSREENGAYVHKVNQFEYTITDRLWYDISLIDCINFLPDGSVEGKNCPGFEGGINMHASGGDCAVAHLPPNAYEPTIAYFVPDDNLSTKSCQPGQTGGDITMDLCAAGGGGAPADNPPPPPPANNPPPPPANNPPPPPAKNPPPPPPAEVMATPPGGWGVPAGGYPPPPGGWRQRVKRIAGRIEY